MKRIIIIFIFLFLGKTEVSAQLQSCVDPRFELTSIVFRLAGVPEFNQTAIPSYAKDIDTFFAPYINHELIRHVRDISEQDGVGYTAVSSTAALLELKGSKISLKLPYKPSDIPNIDSRWSEESFSKYLKYLNDFYRISNFQKFYDDHRELYTVAEQRMDVLLAEINERWFESFYGTKWKTLLVIVNLVNGPSNYAFDQGIALGCACDEEGLPAVSSEFLNIIIHEITHSYTNPLFEQYWSQMQESGEQMFPYVQDLMYQNAYASAGSMLMEWLTNLGTLMYYKDNSPLWLRYLTYVNISRGFIWMWRSTSFMNYFYADRIKYLHFRDFMPQIVGFINYTAQNYNEVIKEYENSRPYIVSVYPQIGTDLSNFDKITITFSEKMGTGCSGISTEAVIQKGIKPLRIYESEFIDDYTFVMYFRPEELEQNTLYGIVIPGDSFQSWKCNYMGVDNNIEIIYKTE